MPKLNTCLKRRILGTGFFALAAIAIASGGPATGAAAFRFSLDNQQVVPPGASSHYGECVGVLGDAEAVLSVICVHNVHQATGAALRHGARGENGSTIFTFPTGEDPVANIPLTPSELADLVLDRLYIVIYSDLYPDGELRGQVRVQRPNDAEQLLFNPTPTQVVPPVTTSAKAFCGFSFEPDELDQFLVVCRHTIDHPTGAVLRRGAPGTNGPVVVDLGSGQSPILLLLPVAPADRAAFFDDLRAGMLYLEIRSSDFPNGELRGQIRGCWASEHTLCLNRGRFSVTMSVTLPVLLTFPANAIADSPDAGQFFFLRPDNREIAIKILNGCGVNDRYWVFFAGTTNVNFTIEVKDTLTGASWSRHHPAGVTTDTVLDTNAFATCP